MSLENELIEKLTTLNHIVETLNRAVDVRSVLDDALAHLVELMGLETGWIFLKDPDAQVPWQGSGYVLAAHHNLPPALDQDSADAWAGGCLCQELCSEVCLTEAYNEVHCSRLEHVHGDRRGLVKHASTPIHSGDRVLGILNVAGPNWDAFSPEALALLTNVGSQMGIALERARLYDLVRERRVQEQAILLDLSNQLLSHPDLEELERYLVEKVRQVLEADACALLLPGDEPGSLDFRAASGWRSDPTNGRQRILLDESNGPGLVMRTQQPLLVEDLESSEALSGQPDWLQGERFRSQAMMPLLANDHSVGVLVLGMRHPRKLDGDEVRCLRLMANQAAMAIEKARLHRQEIKAQSLEQELAVGRQIQLSLLPSAPPRVPGWEFAVFYQAARLVGGDFYDFFELPGEPGRLGIVIADVAGKGVPAALYMALSRTLIRTTALSGHGPAAALMRANELLLNDSQAELFLTAFYAELDTRNGHLVYANAGHNRPLWRRTSTGEFQELIAPGICLGILREIQLEERKIDMAPGDLITFYTDGVTEAMDSSRKPFEEERLQAAITPRSKADAQQVVDGVMEAVRAFSGDVPAEDDMTCLVVKRCP